MVMGKTEIPYIGPTGFPREYEYMGLEWDGNGNKMHGNGN